MVVKKEEKKIKKNNYERISKLTDKGLDKLIKNILVDKKSKKKRPKIKGKISKKSIHKGNNEKTDSKKHSPYKEVKMEQEVKPQNSIKQIVKLTKQKPIRHECVRVPAGIKGFDNLIEGGFEKDSTNLIVGGPGSGKTILSMQYIMDGLKRGESCLFITFEENKSSFYHNMQRFGWDLEKYEKKGIFTFLNYTPSKVKSMLEEGGGIIENIIIKNNVTRLVIDSMTSFTLLFNDELQKREASLELFNMIKKWNCTSLITFEGAPSGEQYRALEFESDSIILIQFNREKAFRRREIEILKMRGTNHSKGLYTFEINKKGIEVNKKPIIKGA